jgi:hypothetical protein
MEKNFSFFQFFCGKNGDIFEAKSAFSISTLNILRYSVKCGLNDDTMCVSEREREEDILLRK